MRRGMRDMQLACAQHPNAGLVVYYTDEGLFRMGCMICGVQVLVVPPAESYNNA
jgi:hypothetical protein